LPRQWQASTYEAVKKARSSRSQSYPPSGKGLRDERVTAGDLRGERASARHAPSSREVESILIAATALPFAGEAETGILVGAFVRKGLQPSGLTATDDHGVLDWLRRRGTSRRSSRFAVKGARYLHSGRVGPHAYSVIASPILGATDGGLGASLRTRRHEERWPSLLYLLAVLHRPGGGGERCARGSLPAFPRKREGYRTPVASKDAHGRRGPTQRHGLSFKRGLSCRRRARIGRSRSCSRVISCCCRSRQTVPAQRSGRTSISPDLEAFVDGRLAHRPCSTYASARSTRRVKKHWHPHRNGNLT